MNRPLAPSSSQVDPLGHSNGWSTINRTAALRIRARLAATWPWSSVARARVDSHTVVRASSATRSFTWDSPPPGKSGSRLASFSTPNR
jgi:hypothetical protein